MNCPICNIVVRHSCAHKMGKYAVYYDVLGNDRYHTVVFGINNLNLNLKLSGFVWLDEERIDKLVMVK